LVQALQGPSLEERVSTLRELIDASSEEVLTEYQARFDIAWIYHDCALEGRRVAVIGSAASAVQFVPRIAPRTAALHVFQRTANWVTPKDDAPYAEEEIERLRSDPEALRALRREIEDGRDV